MTAGKVIRRRPKPPTYFRPRKPRPISRPEPDNRDDGVMVYALLASFAVGDAVASDVAHFAADRTSFIELLKEANTMMGCEWHTLVVLEGQEPRDEAITPPRGITNKQARQFFRILDQEPTLLMLLGTQEDGQRAEIRLYSNWLRAS